jgi:hypothetical protein
VSTHSATRIRAAAGAIAAILALTALAGCAAPRVPGAGELLPHEKPDAPRSVAVVVLPATAADASASTVARAAAAGSLGGAVTAAAAAPAALATGTAALLGPLALTGAGVAVVAFTLADFANASMQRKAAELDTAMQVGAIRASLVPTIMRDLAATLPAIANVNSGIVIPGEGYDARSLRVKGYGSALEVTDISLRFVAGRRSTDEDITYALVHSMQARLIDTSDGRVVGLRGLVVTSPMRFAPDWTQDGGALLRREAERASRTLAEAAIEALLLQVGLAAPGVHSNCGVDLLQPKSSWTFLGGWSVAEAGSLAPTLAWSARPVTSNDSQLPAGASSFRYDVRVWKIIEGEAGRLVVERFGLEETTLPLSEPLEPASVYGWSVRARYVVDGWMRGDRWSAIAAPVGGPAWSYPWYSGIADANGTVQPAPCPHDRYRQACGCCDFVPTSALKRFRTPNRPP